MVCIYVCAILCKTREVCKLDFGGELVDFEKYTNLVNYFFENDNREENYQNRVLIPFFEALCIDSDVVDTSMLTKEWNKRGIERNKFAGSYTPDLLIASNWKLIKTGERVDYKALIEIKTPTAQDRDHAESEVKEYLEKVSFVVLTDCVTWEFYMKEDGRIYYSYYSLEKEHKITHIERNKRYRKKLMLKSTVYNYPTQVCKREGATSIEWSDKYWEEIKRIINSNSICKENANVL